MARIYSLENGDLGTVKLDGEEVKALACCPDEGWARCHVDREGKAVRIFEPSVIDEDADAVLVGLVHGNVEFIPR